MPLGLVLFVAFALAGRPQGKTITTRAEIPAQVQPPTQDVIIRALGSLGIAEINRGASRTCAFPPLPSPVREDGPGWKAEVDLPYGVTASMVIDRREQLASGLRRPLGAVWPEPASHEHAGRLELWVGRADICKAKPPPWPLLRSGQVDVFGELPFGDRRPRPDGQGPADLPQLADRPHPAAGQDARRAGADLRHRPRPAGRAVDCTS